MRAKRKGRRAPAILRMEARPGEHSIDLPGLTHAGSFAQPADGLFAKAVRLHQVERLDAAERVYRKLLRSEPRHAGALNLLGVIMHGRGELKAARQLLSSAIAVNGDAASFHVHLGNVLLDLGHADEAVHCYRRALELDPESGSAHSNLGFALLCLHRRREALAHCQAALQQLPDSVEVLTNKASVLLELGEIEDAAGLYECALRLRPAYLPAMNNLGTARLEQGDFAGALALYSAVLDLDPGHAEARLNRAVIELLRGDFLSGWQDYEARQSARRGNTPQRGFHQPQWRGEPLGLLSGRRILLHAEQGLGDTIQFLRYVPLVASAGGQVVLEVPARLRQMADGLDGVTLVLTCGEPLPEFDWHCPLMSLPLAFGTRLETITETMPTGVPYLAVPGEVRRRVRPPAEAGNWSMGGLRVGLVWAGTPDHLRDWARSMTLAMLESLLAVQGVRFFSLQVGPAAGERTAWPSIVDLTPDPGNLADAAAKMLELDLVIAVDTALAHLAGALGKPVWLMLPWIPDWRWLLNRDDSPWYPTMRLFRQETRGDWLPVVARVRAALAELAGMGSRASGLSMPAEGFSIGSMPGQNMHGESPPPDFGRSLLLERPHRFEPMLAAEKTHCKICAAASALFGVVDFHKSCVEAQGKRLQLSGIPIYYRRCERCGLVFTEAFDHWTDQEFGQRIYNRDYALVDPDFAEVRPVGNARLVAEAFRASREGISILDYGGGSGRFAELLRGEGFNAATYDPFSQHRTLPQDRFDLLTCFEVMEHTPRPLETLQAMDGLLKEDGLILFSTLLQPKDFDRQGLSWWYAGPRNGHCSLYSADALVRLFASIGMRVASWNEALHLAYRKIPAFAAHLRIG